MKAAVGASVERAATETDRSAAGPTGLGGSERAREQRWAIAAHSTGLLVLIVALALGLRLWGLGWQLPWEFHPDEGHYVWKAVDMVRDGNLNPKYFRNPSLYTYLLLGQFTVLDAIGPLLDRLPSAWEALRAPSVFVLFGRLTTALLGAATVAMVYQLGSELLGRQAGLLGALFLAVSFLHVRDSHFATNDVPATFFLVVSVLFSALLAHSGRVSHALLAGLFGGLATSTKYNAGFFAVPLLAAHALAWRRAASAAPAGRPIAGLLGAGLLSIIAYLAGTPFTLLAWPAFRDDFLVQQRFARSGWEGQGAEPVGLLYLDALGQGLGWVALSLALLGMLLLARRRPGAALVLAGYPLAYLAFMLGVKLFFVRFTVTVAPFLCLAAGYGALELARLGRGSLQRATLLGLLALAAVAQPLWNNLQHSRILAQTDTRAQAYAWLEANLPAGARIIADEYTVRDRRPRADLPDRARFDLDVVNPLSEREVDYYRSQGFQYAVVSSFQYQRFPGRHETYSQLERQARQLAVFAPTADGRELPFDVEELYSPFHDLSRYQRPGPTVKIYALE
jgi:4-amino-4-deoxy-L-arabinose transferase-like glycosyltransferase